MSRFDGNGVYFKTKIVEEVTTPETARKIMESETEDITLSLASQDMGGEAENSVRAGEAVEISVAKEGDGGEDVQNKGGEDFLSPCEGTFPVCCAADLSTEVK